MSWNVRGANDLDKRKIIKAFLKTQKVDVVCLQETKLKEITRGVIQSLGVGRFLDWTTINVEGASRGIVIFWDSRVLQLIGKEEGHFSVSCRFKNYEDNFQWVFTGVYGPIGDGSSVLLWEKLGAIRGLWDNPCCIGGDFNVIELPRERNREARISSDMRNFSQVIDDLELKDFPLGGGCFPWRAVLNNQREAKLDRFLATED